MAWVGAALLSLVVIAYNNLLNRWLPFQGPAYVPLNVAFAILMTTLAAAGFESSRADLGLQGDIGDVIVGLVGVGAFGIAMFAVASSRYARRIADRRVLGLEGSALAYQVLVRIPLGTALAEELLFRGALFAMWRGAGASNLGAALCSAVAFGLWHISPTILLVRINDPEAGNHKLRVAVAGAVLFTSLAALGLTCLRLKTYGLLAPIVLHAGINSAGTLAAVVAGRRAEVLSENDGST